MIGRDAGEFYPKTRAKLGETVLEVRSLNVRRQRGADEFAVRDVTFAMRRGEILGLFGLMGAGRTEVLHAIFGSAALASGGISVAGKNQRIRSPRDAIQAGIALAPEDRKSEGLVLSMSIVENSTLAAVQRVCRFGMLSPALERRVTHEFTGRLGVKTPSLNLPVRNLSGGNQQKVIIGKWLATKPQVLLLDEPTRGIDVNAKREVYLLIEELASSGLGILFVSSELPEILAVSDRVLVMAEGQITAEFSRRDATEERILNAALPRPKRQLAESV
jgi:ribose transport system ATP-binding protein